MPVTPAKSPLSYADDPAADAAALLIRVALIALAILLPIASILSRRSIFTLMPLGAGLVLLAAFIAPRGEDWRRLGRNLASINALIAFTFLIWAALSLAWTPAYLSGLDRILKSGGTGILALLAIAFLPERTRIANLYLVPIGLTLAAAIALPLGYFHRDAITQDRAAVMLVLLLWPALAVLASRERWWLAGVLAVLTAGAIFTLQTPITMIALAAGALTVAVAFSHPRPAALLLGCAAFLLFALAPAVAYFAHPLASDHYALLATLGVWGDLLHQDWPRLITGHGIEAAQAGINAGYISPGVPKSLLFRFWYDLGAIGVLSFAFIVMQSFFFAAQVPLRIAPFMLAGLVAGLTIAIFTESASQIWWVSLISGIAILSACVLRGHYKTERPSAKLTSEPPKAPSAARPTL
ncbi:hypothetical protein [Methylovirgula sp. 4M-Z18]|uniref:hypothetical protein n=1 Tax=Methylovirgula sp. 4M-Z18 TaxID=2293567 RepID=UPI000E2F4D22|nr:hypothetical protein [Methylovirgula sp. 4M-Z18]RFB75693.1 hypothetical protein DYH55_21920 [Methylovirgula sp. 4M-Z18]